MNNSAISKAKSFVKKYKFYKPDINRLISIVESQGFTVIRFNGIDDDSNVTSIVTAFNLTEYIKSSKAFIFANKDFRLVFLNEDLSEDEQLLVLLHEEGHIFCEHLKSTPILGRDVTEEHEANEFSHYVLYPGLYEKAQRVFLHHKKLVITALVVFFIAVSTAIVGRVIVKEASYLDGLYVTDTGKRYHKEDCIFVKNKTNSRRLTEEEFNSGEFERCNTCLPE